MRFTHPSQDQDGKDSAFTASTAELFKPLPTIEEIKAKLKEWIRMADEATPGPWHFGKTCVGIPAVFESCQALALFEVRRFDEASPLPNLNANATFIATSRTAAPLAWKALLGTIEALELCHIRHDGDDPAVFDALQSIREQFKEVVL